MLRCLGISCGLIVLLIALAGGAMFWFGPKLLDMAKDMMAEEGGRQQLAENWNPPAADAPADDIFPLRLETYKREAADDVAKIAELHLDVSGKHAVYRDGASRIDLYVYPVSKLECEALFNRIENDKSSGMRTWSKVDLGGNYARIYLWSNTLKQNHLWFVQGRLVVLRTTDEADREGLLKAFFRAGAKEHPANEKPANDEPAKGPPKLKQGERAELRSPTLPARWIIRRAA